MIDTQSLRGKILDRALHGELTCQLPEDGTGAQLYQEIIEKRKELSKAGRIKNLKKLPEVSEDEWLFEIPQSWKWIRLGNVASIFGGKRIPAGRKLTTEDTGHKYIRVSEMKNETVIIEDMLYVPEDIYPSISQYIINKEDVYITVAGTIGRVGKIPEEIDGANLTENADRIVFDMIDQDWLISCLSSSEIQKEISLSTTQVAQPKLAIKRIEDLIIPLPPLNEQKRMVHILNQVFSILDTINALQDQYASNQEALKGKIIEAAIQGKLTEQLPEDGTADALYHSILEEKQLLIKAGKLKKEKSLPEIVEDEIPFEIPENWRWVRISDVIDVRDGTHDSPKYHDEGIPLVTSKNISSGKLIFEDVKLISMDDAQKINERSYIDDGDILFAMIGSIGNPVIVHKDREFCIKNVALFKNFAPMHISMDYFYWFLMHEQFVLRKNAIGGLQPFVSLKVFRSHLMPLPPMSEQIRIAERLYELEDVVLEQEK